MLFKSEELSFTTQCAIKLTALAIWGVAAIWWYTGSFLCNFFSIYHHADI
jgi:hypothetical protein